MPSTRRFAHWLPLAALLLFAAGCATQVPTVIQTAPPSDLRVGEARAEPEAHLGTQVRWGGSIVQVENRAEDTLLSVLSRPLDSAGRPREDRDSEGRFIARVPGFLDPAVYATGRQVTVSGSLAEVVTRPIGDHPYRFPVVDVSAYYLWEPRREPRYDPFLDDPWWHYPWYPWGPSWWSRPPYYW